MEAENLVLSTMKKCEDDETVVIRVFDSAGKPTNGHLTLFTPIQKAEETNLLEDVVEPLPFDKNRVEVKVGAHEIHTIRITPAQ